MGVGIGNKSKIRNQQSTTNHQSKIIRINNSLSRQESLDQLNLSCVVQVVRRDASHECEIAHLTTCGLLDKITWPKRCHRLSQGSMRARQQLDVGLPRFRGRLLRPCHPVRTFLRKRSTLRVRQSSPRHVLPVRGMNDEFPDVVAIGARPPRRLLWRHAADRSTQIRPMPRRMVIGAVDEEEEVRYQLVVCSAASPG